MVLDSNKELETLIRIYSDVYKTPIPEGAINSLKQYVNKGGYDRDQLEQIYKGIKSGVNISVYDKQVFPHHKMCWLRRGLEAGFEMKYYIDFNTSQISIIVDGLRAGVDVLKYAKPYYTSHQMYQIYLGLLAGIEPAYLSNEYTSQQMDEIRLAQLAGVQYQKLLNNRLTTHQMKQMRLDMELGN